MAYVFGFDKNITDLIYSMRDFKLEKVKRNHGTPSRIALMPYFILNRTIEYVGLNAYEMGITTYWITVATRKRLRGLWIIGLLDNKFEK